MIVPIGIINDFFWNRRDIVFGIQFSTRVLPRGSLEASAFAVAGIDTYDE